MTQSILVVNCGSSSLKLALFDENENKLASAIAERLNGSDAFARIDGDDRTVPLPRNANHKQALTALVLAFRERKLMPAAPTSVGHRVVHGGETFREAVLINDDVVEAINDCAGLAPLHNPVNLAGIEATREQFPETPQVAVFDTAYHQTLAPHAYLYALPESFYRDWSVRRYGFHGTSHFFMANEAARLLDKTLATTSIISAHLGNGCSITAIKDGFSVDTSMGLTPLEGLVMGTRCGDIDPGLFDYLSSRGMQLADVHKELNKNSGLLGISGKTNDMRTLCELADQGHEPSALAIDIFCFRLAKYVGAMMASLDHLDALVFTGGIGENSSRVRQKTLGHLKLLGFELDADRNEHNGRQSGGRIESAGSRFPVLVVPTNEELVIAREASRLAASFR
ncbi:MULTISPECIES: acetate kinase [Marinobacter]|uniref:Acetate kinase n=1 Tax=Marinobacter xiaoshiensis TaxID=3073652 RepID=A0ABU2HG24_9GAMM|nr:MULTISPECIES: acetate kinase [unclassified Marinobacter]MBK1874854.1 acetate kinase [Marinobacter sp. 1-3A]MBK1887696.1 acetate kinase [Marinobacter sp. DY40_1A1]MDS1310028.1 acetate kinase [Marinobacter sp. F60267]